MGITFRPNLPLTEYTFGISDQLKGHANQSEISEQARKTGQHEVEGQAAFLRGECKSRVSFFLFMRGHPDGQGAEAGYDVVRNNNGDCRMS